MSVGTVYAATATGWTAPGRPTLPGSATVNREDRAPGSYIPGWTADTVGPHAGTTFVDVEADAAGMCWLAPGTYSGRRFWGAVRPSAAGTVILIDCQLAGMDPRKFTTTAWGAVQNTVADRWIELYDCLLDGFLWADVRGAMVTTTMTQAGGTFQAKTSAFSNGLRGCNIKARRTEVRNFQDLANQIGNNWDVQLCWIHAGWYAKGGVGTSADGQTHTDALQFNYGNSMLIKHNMIGGLRNADGYNAPAPGYNAGDDTNNAIFMIQQEVSADPLLRVEDILITENWLAGSNTMVNLNYKNSNDLSGVTISNNKFLRAGTTDPRNDPNGAYIWTKPTLHPVMSGNVLWDYYGPIEGSGTPTPIRVVAA